MHRWEPTAYAGSACYFFWSFSSSSTRTHESVEGFLPAVDTRSVECEVAAAVAVLPAVVATVRAAVVSVGPVDVAGRTRGTVFVNSIAERSTKVGVVLDSLVLFGLSWAGSSHGRTPESPSAVSDFPDKVASDDLLSWSDMACDFVCGKQETGCWLWVDVT